MFLLCEINTPRWIVLWKPRIALLHRSIFVQPSICSVSFVESEKTYSTSIQFCVAETLEYSWTASREPILNAIGTELRFIVFSGFFDACQMQNLFVSKNSKWNRWPGWMSLVSNSRSLIFTLFYTFCGLPSIVHLGMYVCAHNCIHADWLNWGQTCSKKLYVCVHSICTQLHFHSM